MNLTLPWASRSLAFGGKILGAGLQDRQGSDRRGTPVIANYRALGLAEMANAILEGRSHRCSGRFAMHALAVMLGIIDSAESGEPVKIGILGAALPALTEGGAKRLLRKPIGEI